MNIWALNGHRVIVTEETARNGYDHHKEQVKKLLTIGQEYMVNYTVVHSSSTDVHLQGFKDSFNSVNFEDVEEQSEELDCQHEDWSNYNDDEDNFEE